MRYRKPLPGGTVSVAYRTRSLGASSTKLGPCDVCGEYASDVFIQAEEATVEDEDGDHYKTYLGRLFGHPACLERAQRVAP